MNFCILTSQVLFRKKAVFLKLQISFLIENIVVDLKLVDYQFSNSEIPQNYNFD